MSRLKLIKIKDEGSTHPHWFAPSINFGNFGGIFINPPSPWKVGQGERFTHYSVTRCDGGAGEASRSFRKFRHAKKLLSKWVNP